MQDHRFDGGAETSMVTIDEAMSKSGKAFRPDRENREIREAFRKLERELEEEERPESTTIHAGELARRLERARRSGGRTSTAMRKRKPNHERKRRQMAKASRRRNR